MSAQQYDVVVIGAGPAGEVIAGRLAKSGLDVAIVEKHLVAGECSFYACMPSKALVRPGHLLAEVRRVPGAAEAVTGTIDVPAALVRRDEVIHDLDDSEQTPWLDHMGIDLYRGTGALTGERAVQVTATDGSTTDLEAGTAVVLATGSTASVPPVPGLREAAPWTNREATTTHEIPARVAFIGTGPVGCELADAYARFGAKVTLLGQEDRLLAREEAVAGEQVAAVQRELGVDLRLGVKLTKVERPEPGGPVTIHVTAPDGGESVVEVDEVVVAAGRVPNSAGLGLDAVGAEPNAHGYVDVDRHLRVGELDWLYAIGDLNGRALLTHEGKYQAHVAAQVILGAPGALLRDDGPPVRVTFTEPEVAAVGHTEATAKEAGLDVRAVDVPTDSTAGASFVGKGAPGTCRIVVDEARGVIVGATFTGVEMGEQLHAATIAIVSGIPIARLWDAVPAFPSRTEIWLRLLEAYEGW
ncbi:MAG: NAD(P)/FAD-dependent oxidoreductase [Solirubrobacteraceae bacterium]|nr:NAD(P)/FAD-dependent oxidoreductase [Solirubrobacteraceae bacterium]